MKKYLMIILLFVLIPIQMFAQYSQMNFPLQVGNRWQYSEVPGNYSESKVIKDTLMSNGLTYTKVTGELFSGFFRKDGTKILLYNLSSNDESLLYDFSLKSGDTLFTYINNQDTVVKTVYEEGTVEIFGHQRYYMAFLTKHSSSSLYGINYVTDGFGFTRYNGEVFSFGLAGAIINGIQYGIILQVHNDDKNLPTIYHLFQNFPNPFNPITKIIYSIPLAANVEIKIYDVLGNEVVNLVNEYKIPGIYEIEFEANNLSSGIYFYRIKSGKYSETKKMLLLR